MKPCREKMDGTVYVFTNHNEKRVVWMATNLFEELLDFAQYIIDGSNDPEQFLVCDTRWPNSTQHLMDVAKGYGMRKRTFDERMNGVTTYTI